MDKPKAYNFIYNGTPELLSELLSAAGVFFPMPCAGRGVCGKCRVRVKGKLSEPDARERELLSEAELKSGVRLACRAYALGDVSAAVFDIAELQSFSESHGSAVLPERVFAAVDVGTTAIAVSLTDETGARLCEKTVLNPQTAFGSDVLSRLEKAVNGEGAKLQKAVSDALAELISGLCPDSSRLSGINVTGNTSMLYLLTGRTPESLTHAPFNADCLFGESVPAKSISDALPEKLSVYLPRCASAFVGADIICSVLAAEREYSFLSDKPQLLADIGTNGEIVLSHNNRIYACSTAAGPAFEGACLHSGSVAVKGAVSSVRLRGGKILSGVIGGGRGKTVCGSGALDAVSVMLTAGILDDTGYIKESGHAFCEYVSASDGGNSFLLPDTDVYITQEDVRNIQLAKSAICAGILTLIKAAELKPEDIDTLFIAGGFGSFLSIKSASHIGLIPGELEEKVTVLGNAALRGAEMLASKDEQKHAETLAEITETLELSSSPEFFDEYINNMTFTV